MRVEAVKCEQDMSGQYFPMQGRPFSPDDDGSCKFGTTNARYQGKLRSLSVTSRALINPVKTRGTARG